MKIALSKKTIIAMALFLIAGLLFATTLHVYGMNAEYKAVTENIQAVAKAKKEAALSHYIHQVKLETAAAMVEPVVEVAAPVEKTEEVVTEEPVVEEVVVEETYVEETYEEETYTADYSSGYDVYYSADDLRFNGVIYAGDWRWTWYSQNVLPGGGLSIPGRHVDENGYVCDENGRICLASSDLAWGTVVSTPFGKEGCVYDCGCDSGTLDVYVDF